MAISHTVAALIQMKELGEAINSAAFVDSFGLSVMAQSATWVSSRRFKCAPLEISARSHHCARQYCLAK